MAASKNRAAIYCIILYVFENFIFLNFHAFLNFLRLFEAMVF